MSKNVPPGFMVPNIFCFLCVYKSLPIPFFKYEDETKPGILYGMFTSRNIVGRSMNILKHVEILWNIYKVTFS